MGWIIVNYPKYRAIKAETDRREYMRNYMRNYRDSIPRVIATGGCKHSKPCKQSSLQNVYISLSLFFSSSSSLGSSSERKSSRLFVNELVAVKKAKTEEANRILAAGGDASVLIAEIARITSEIARSA